jgi:Fic family protein
LAIVHAEFESIHPFLDGNGRIGRLIIPLFLYAHGLLSRPNFYLSEYLETNRDEYYDRMLAVSRDDDWSGWVAFFLRGIIAQAEANTQKAQAILALHQDKRDWVVEITHSQYAVRALDWIFQRPIFQTPDFIASAQIPPQRHARSSVTCVIMACCANWCRHRGGLPRPSCSRNC